MADGLDKLYDHIVRHFAMKDGLIDVDLTAAASEDGQAIEEEKSSIIERQSDQARQMRESFRAGLSTAWELEKSGTTELRLNDQDPVENSIADALIRYLVSYGLASTRAEQTSESSYIYHISVNWPKLLDLSAQIGVDLDATLAAVS